MFKLSTTQKALLQSKFNDLMAQEREREARFLTAYKKSEAQRRELLTATFTELFKSQRKNPNS